MWITERYELRIKAFAIFPHSKRLSKKMGDFSFPRLILFDFSILFCVCLSIFVSFLFGSVPSSHRLCAVDTRAPQTIHIGNNRMQEGKISGACIKLYEYDRNEKWPSHWNEKLRNGELKRKKKSK